MSDAHTIPHVCRRSSELEAVLAPHRTAGERIAFVPTMGALHEGHLSLVRHAATLAPVVVVSIFVNPTQFDVATDLARYPRDLDRDLVLLATAVPDAAGRTIVYAPDVDDLYPDGPVTTVHIAGVTERLCGASRPGHFDGVATVVDLLLERVRPDVAVFGRKDHQQVVVVRQLVAERGHDVDIVAAPTVRDADGIALSSRNQLLDADGRLRARGVPRALAAAVIAARSARTSGGTLRTAELVALARDVLRDAGVDELDYLEVVDPQRIVALPEQLEAHREALLAVAVHVPGRTGPVRLIDNVVLGDVDDEERLLAAVGRT
jgi:pantoate--beta-alanine ligase